MSVFLDVPTRLEDLSNGETITACVVRWILSWEVICSGNFGIQLNSSILTPDYRITKQVVERIRCEYTETGIRRAASEVTLVEHRYSPCMSTRSNGELTRVECKCS